MKKKLPYWHEAPQEEIDKYIKEGKIAYYVFSLYRQPEWCDYPDALSLLGCWSLTDVRKNGMRKKISPDFCSGCPEFNKDYNNKIKDGSKIS